MASNTPRTSRPGQLAALSRDHDERESDSVSPTIVQAVLKENSMMRHLIQAVQDTSPSLLRTTNTNLLTSAGDDKPPIPSPRQWVVPQSLYRPVASITWRESQECTIGRITFDLKTEVPGKQGVPMSILLNEPESVIAKALQGADDEVLLDLVRRDVRSVTLRVVWPAYPDYCFEQNIELISADSSSESTGTITRAELARHIAEAFSSFIQTSRTLPLSDDPWEAGFHFGPGGLSFGSLWLVSLWQVDENVFEAEVRHSGMAPY